jgi:hypothetical protein
MKGDFTRLSFDKSKHYRGVLMQQGRVQLDSDWNEQVQIAEHRYSTFFSDFVGQSGTKGDDMRIEPTTDSKGRDTVLVKSGHYYVDGLLVENDSDMLLPALPADSNGLYLYYLDVWPREVTAAEDQNLKEQALSGPDTTVRVKTEWQVRCQNLKNASVEEICKRYQGGAWPQPQPARNEDNWQLTLSTGKMAVDKTNFQSSDNRLYRVEVHTGNRDENGNTVKPTFKWSRDNGSVVAPVSAVDDKTITIADASLSIQNAFRDAELVEVCDYECARNCRPGYLATQVNVSDIGNGTIVVQKWLDDKSPPKDLSKPIIIRRWDGAYSDKIPAKFELEKGLKVSFTGGEDIYLCGDYWLVLVRSRVVQNWTNEDFRPPDGIGRHCAALALVQMENGRIVVMIDGKKAVTDLRVLFEPLTSYNVSTTGDVCIGGKLGVGFLDPKLLRAPLSVAALNGTLLSFQDPAGCEVGRISHSAPPSALSITDQDGKGLVIQSGNVGIGTDSPDPKFKLDVKADKAIKLGLEGMGGGQLQIACNRDDNKIFLEAFDSTGQDHAAEFLLTGRYAQNVPKLSLYADTTYIVGNVGIGTTMKPGAKLEVSGGGGSSIDFIVNGRLQSSSHDGGLWVGKSSLHDGRFVGSDSGNGIGFYNGGWRLVVSSDGNVSIGGALSVNDGLLINGNVVIDDEAGWHLSYGDSGWCNETHGGGWRMEDDTWIRSYGGKSIYQDQGILRTDGVLQVGENGNRFIVTADGNVGIGITGPPGARLHVEATNKPTIMAQGPFGGLMSGASGGHGVFGTNLYVDSTSQLRLAGTHDSNYGYAGMLASWGSIRFYATQRNTSADELVDPEKYIMAIYENGIWATVDAAKPGGGPWSSSSDIRLKKNVKPLKGALDQLLKLRGVNFEWKEPEKHGNLTGKQMGLVADEVEEVFPEWIGTDRNGFKSLSIRGFEALTIESFRDLNTVTNELMSKNREIEDRIKVLEKKIKTR